MSLRLLPRRPIFFPEFSDISSLTLIFIDIYEGLIIRSEEIKLSIELVLDYLYDCYAVSVYASNNGKSETVDLAPLEIPYREYLFVYACDWDGTAVLFNNICLLFCLYFIGFFPLSCSIISLLLLIIYSCNMWSFSFNSCFSFTSFSISFRLSVFVLFRSSNRFCRWSKLFCRDWHKAFVLTSSFALRSYTTSFYSINFFYF